MNWYQGLRRVSAVIWSVLGVAVGLTCVAFAFEVPNDLPRVVGRLVGGLGFDVLAFYCLHKLTCWVLNGFFVAKA